jgi:hypothetical protein
VAEDKTVMAGKVKNTAQVLDFFPHCTKETVRVSTEVEFTPSKLMEIVRAFINHPQALGLFGVYHAEMLETLAKLIRESAAGQFKLHDM